jgi:selenocysteine lyase/cysteine desulfurase
VASCLDRIAEGSGRRTVALTEAEFPTVAHVWKALELRGTPLRWIPVDHDEGRVREEAVASALDDDVLLLSASHGYYQTGALLDLDRVVAAARAAGVITYVDAYQSLGTHRLDVKERGVDLLASGNLKFLMGIPGIAFLYVRRELAERLEPAVTGWFGRADPFAFDPFRDRPLDWAEGARRFDGGTPPVLPAYVARAGMEWLLDVGLDAVGEWTRTLAARLIEGGRDRGLALMGPDDTARRTPTVAFRVDDSHAVEDQMRRLGVLASARGPAIRLAPHVHSSIGDVDRALDVLGEVLG